MGYHGFPSCRSCDRQINMLAPEKDLLPRGCFGVGLCPMPSFGGGKSIVFGRFVNRPYEGIYEGLPIAFHRKLTSLKKEIARVVSRSQRQGRCFG